MQNGELPVHSPPRVVVLLAGSSDLQERSCTAQHAETVADSILELLSYLHRMLPSTIIVVVSILPKGVSWPNYCSQAITDVNMKVKVIDCLL